MRTGSVNRVWLMGWVARPPVLKDGMCRLLVVTREGGDIERHRVMVPGVHVERAARFATGDEVYVEGQLARHVVAEDVWVIAEAEPVEEANSAPAGTHSSPRPHERRGHWRRTHRGMPGERLVWVRPTAVGR